MVSAQAEVLWGGERFREMFGFPPDSRYPDASGDLVHPEDRSVPLDALATGRPVRYRIRNGSGRHVWVESTVTNCLEDPDVGGVVVVLRDVDALVSAEQALTALQRRGREVADLIAQAVLECDSDGVIRSSNAACAAMLGWPADELIGRRWSELMHPDDREFAKAAAAEASAGTFGPYEVRALRCDGTAVPVLAWTRPVAPVGQPDKHGWVTVFSDLTPTRALEAELSTARTNARRVAEHFALVLSSMGESLIEIDQTGTVLFANPRLSAMTGSGPDEVVGHSWLSLVHPEDATGVYATYAGRVLVPGDEVSYRTRLRTVDGSGLAVQVRANGFETLDGFRVVAVFSDVSELVSAQRELTGLLDRAAAAETRQRQVADTVAEGLVVISETDAVLYANPALCDLFGLRREQVIGRPWAELAARYLHEIHRADTFPGNGAGVAYRLRRGDGTERIVQVRSSTMRHATVPVQVKAISDITAIETARHKATAATEAKTAFVARVAHELRNPLQPIIGIADLLQQSETPSDVAGLAAMIDHAGGRMLRLIDDLVDLERLGLAKMPVACEPVALHEICREVAERAQYATPDRPITVAGDHRWVLGDHDRIDQLISGIVANAQRYATGPIDIAVHHDDGNDRVICRIADHGPGIPAPLREQAFEPFNRLGTQHPDSTGLGLAIARELVTAMNGTIGLDDTPGGGLTAEIDLPTTPARSTEG